MTKLLLLVSFVFAVHALRAASAIPVSSLKIISVEDAKTHLNMLAADSMAGRNTPSPQLDIAARYIADRFKEYGLQPLHGSYIQPYNVSRINLGKENSFAISRTHSSTGTIFNTTTGETKTNTISVTDDSSMVIKTDFVPYDFTAGTVDSGEVVFAGYGITAPEYKYDDYAGIDVNNKFVFVLRHEPDEKGTDTTFFRGKKWTRYAEVREKMKNAIAHGARGILVVNDPGNHIMLKPEGYPWPSLFFKTMSPADLPIQLDLGDRKNILAVHCGERVMTLLFGSIDSLKSIQHRIDSTHMPASFALNDLKVRLGVSLERTSVPVPNVAGWWQGERSDSDHIVIGAHMDHVGTMHASEAGQDTIFNGADDNASGTTGLLEVARAFTAAPTRPHRSVLFVAFSGEEKGLFGSRSYAANPLVSLSQCSAMLNMDMIGRNDPDSLELGGAGHSPELTALAEQENSEIGLKIKESDDFTGRSDQASFSAKKIPVLFFFTGEHKDYHQVTDSPDKINFEKLVRIATLCFRTSWDLTMMDTRYVYKDEPGK